MDDHSSGFDNITNGVRVEWILAIVWLFLSNIFELASEKVVVEFFFGLLFFNYRVFIKKEKKKKPEGTSFWPLDADHLMDTWTLANRWN